MTTFSESEFDELDAWLVRGRTGITDIIELEGFLTAIVIGPTTLHPMIWLPKVWGGKTPKFASLEEMNRFMALVMGYYNDLVMWFEQDPERFEPTFYESSSGGKPVVIVDEWCVGFLKGVRLDSAVWKPMDKADGDLLKPMRLFGTPAGWKELQTGGEVAMHRKWSPKVTLSVRAIHRFWLAYRGLAAADSVGETRH